MDVDVETALEAARLGAEVAGEIYARGGAEVVAKTDGSPVTEADLASERRILARLATTGLPIVSEESAGDPGARAAWPRFWLVDPLDGTRDFVARTGDFCVCVALIAGGRVAFGAVVAPAQERAWIGTIGGAAFAIDLRTGARRRIAARAVGDPAPLVGLTSRFHAEPATKDVFAALGIAATETFGSAIKFTRIAEGLADAYPGLGKTKDWDIAAGHAVLAAAGGFVSTYPEMGEIRYDRGEFQTPHFLAGSGRLRRG